MNKQTRPVIHQEWMAKTGGKGIGHNQQAVMGHWGAIADPHISPHA